MIDLTNLLEDDIPVPYPALLDALHERCAGDGLATAPASAAAPGYVLASAAKLPGAADSPLRRFGLAFGTAPAPREPGSAGQAEEFAVGLLGLHRNLLVKTLRYALGHLDTRTSGGTSLLTRQLIQGQLADVAMALSAEEAMPPGRREADPQARWRSHQRMVAAGRELIRLLGASGFLAESPAADLHLAEVAGNVYLHPGETHD